MKRTAKRERETERVHIPILIGEESKTQIKRKKERKKKERKKERKETTTRKEGQGREASTDDADSETSFRVGWDLRYEKMKEGKRLRGGPEEPKVRREKLFPPWNCSHDDLFVLLYRGRQGSCFHRSLR